MPLPSRLPRSLRWLLQLDRPAPWRDEADIAAEVEANYRWNYTVNLLDGASFWFGASFVSSATIVPLFISKLTPDPFFIGLAATLAQGGWFLPQLFTAQAVERLARKKPVVVNLGFFLERLPTWLLVLAAWLAGRAVGAALALFLLGYAWHSLGAGVIATAWQDLIARCFPVARRGSFFGAMMFVGAAMGAGAAAWSAWLLQRLPYPANFTVIFSLGAAGITLSWFFLALTRESAQPATAPRQSQRAYWADVGRIVRQDHNFRRFLAGRGLLALGDLATGFVTVAAVARWQTSDSLVGLYTVALLLGQTTGNLLFGRLADRFGHKQSLEWSALAAMAAFVLAWLAPGPQWYLLVFALLGLRLGGVIVSGILVVMEFCPPGRRPTYAGLANTWVGIISSLGPLLGATLAPLGYGWLFGLAAGISLLALLVLRGWVKEPRYQGPYTAEG